MMYSYSFIVLSSVYMVGGLVQKKEFKKIKRKKEKFRTNKKKANPKTIWKLVQLIWVTAFVLVLFYAILYLLRITILAPEYTIKQVNYDPASIQEYDDPYLYKAISNVTKERNYYILRYFKQGYITHKIKQEFPIVKDIAIQYDDQYTLWVTVSFEKPQIRLIYKELTFGLYNDYIFQLYSGNTIWNDILDIEFPEYIWEIQNFDGLFFKVKANQFTEQMYLLNDAFPDRERLVYLPWSQRTLIVLKDGKRLYINNLWDLKKQIKNYDLLTKYYDGYKDLYEIDLGSLEEDKIIVN